MKTKLSDVNLLHQSADSNECVSQKKRKKTKKNKRDSGSGVYSPDDLSEHKKILDLYLYLSQKRIKKKNSNVDLADKFSADQYLSTFTRKGRDRSQLEETVNNNRTNYFSPRFSKKIKKIGFVWLYLYAFTSVVRTAIYIHNNMDTLLGDSTNIFYKSVNTMSESVIKVSIQKYVTDAERGVMDEYNQINKCSSTRSWSRKAQATIMSVNNCPAPTNIWLGKKNEDLTVDVLSLGYKDRLEFLETQRQTWASHQYVRSFWGLTEIDDMARNCESTIVSDVKDHIRTCKSYHRSNSEGLKKFRTDLYDMTYVGKKKNPKSWLCAQSRLILGFIKLLNEYQRLLSTEFMSKVLPDYLAIVEDDTYLNMQLFGDFVKDKNPDIPITYSGCSANLVVQLGGFNLFLSKGVIERLITPLTCSFSSKRKKKDENTTSTNLSSWMKSACKTLDKSPLGEYDIFHDGMSLVDVAYLLASKESFCMFAGWFMKYLLAEYLVSEPTEDTGKLVHPYFEAENCANNGDLYCKISSQVCFWQTPESMVATTSVVYSDLLNKIKTNS